MANIEIRINETKRTKHSLIRDLVSDCIEDENMGSWQEIIPETLEQCLLNSKLFSKVTATVEKPVIRIEVDERWTLLPIPYIYSSGGDYTFGLFLMENNLFGLGKKGGIGGNISSNGNSFFLFFFDPSILFSDWSTSFRLANTVKEPLMEYDDQEYYSYEVTDFSYGFNISRKIFLPELWLAFGILGNNKDYERVDSFPPPEDYDSFGVKTRLYYKDTDFKFYFNEGLKANLEVDLQTYRSDDKDETTTWELTIDYQKQFIGRNALQLQAKLQEISDATLGDALLLGRDKGFRGIDSQGLWVYSAQSLSIDYQIPVKHYDYGTWTISPFIDLAHFDPAVDIPVDSFFSVGIGGSLFLKDIAFPGVSLFMGYNDEFNDFFVSFSLGMRF